MKIGKITSALALTLAVASVPAMAVNTRAIRTTQTASMDGFTRMDRNRDGMISRGEWTRDEATFRRLDLDRDNMLTRAESRQAWSNGDWRDGKGKKNKRFNGLDTNNDGVITRNEWRGNDNSFRQHDRNGDGVISGDEMRGGKGWNKSGDDDDDRDHGKKEKHKDKDKDHKHRD